VCHSNLLLYSHALFCFDVHSTSRFHRLFSQLRSLANLYATTSRYLSSQRSLTKFGLLQELLRQLGYIRLEPVARVENRISALSSYSTNTASSLCNHLSWLANRYIEMQLAEHTTVSTLLNK